MSSALRQPMTHEEFFAWIDERDGGRYEFDGVRPVAMSGGINRHGMICRNLNGLLFALLRGRPCQSTTAEGGGVVTPGDRIRYPDAAVTCSPIQEESRYFDHPVVVFEVVSRGSAHQDHVVKRLEYHGVPSIKRYVVIEHERVLATVHCRQNLEPWATTVVGPGQAIDLPEIGIAIPMDELYEGLAVV